MEWCAVSRMIGISRVSMQERALAEQNNSCILI